MSRRRAVPRLRHLGLLGALALVSVLPAPGALWPRLTYYFRDVSVTFYPLRSFAADELRAGRWPVWNPYVFEGTFAVPYFHVLDLLHVALPGPVAFSFLLTLQFPIAAMGAYALLRDMGGGKPAAFVAGAVYALGGLAQSSANLYVFLQALALAPLIVLTLRRAVVAGGRWVGVAALVTAFGLTTLAVEFVGQAVLLGALVALAERPRRRAAGRLGMALLLAAGLAGIALLPLLGLLPETVRGAGLDREVALGYATPPLALLQVLVPNLFGDLADPVQVFWGGHFFPKLPYLLSLYLGPLVLALSLVGLAQVTPRVRAVLVALALLGLWFSLGEAFGLAPLLRPLLPFVRYPSKAHLLPYLSATLLAGLGLDALGRGEGWSRFQRGALGLAFLLAVPLTLVGALPEAVRAYAQLPPETFPSVRWAVFASLGTVLVLALASAALAFAVRRGVTAAPRAAALVGLLAILDLARAHAGMNPQVDPSFFALVPELQAERLDRLEGGRVFAYPVESSPAFGRYLASRPRNLRLGAFFVNRQMLAPFLNVLDGIRAPDHKDLTSFTPRPPALRPEDYRPDKVAAIVPWMRMSGVARVLSLDELDHPDLRLRVRVPAGPPGLDIHVYELARPAPFVTVACASRVARGPEEASALALDPGFDGAREVVLEKEVATRCQRALVEPGLSLPAERHYRTRSDGPGLLVERENFARGWRAEVDGRATPVLRANGKHRAVLLPEGEHQVALRYEAPGLPWGIASSVVSLAVVAGLLSWPRRPEGATE